MEQLHRPDADARLSAEPRHGQRLEDERSRWAVEVFERYAEGSARAEDLAEVVRGAQEVAEDLESADNPYAAGAVANALKADTAASDSDGDAEGEEAVTDSLSKAIDAEIQPSSNEDRCEVESDVIARVLNVLQGLLQSVESPVVRACLEGARDDIAHLAGRDVSHDEGGDLAVACGQAPSAGR